MERGIGTFPVAAILGSIAIIACIDWINRKHMLTFTFCALAAVLAVSAGSIQVLSREEDYRRYILVILWNLTSFLFSFGPNTLTFIVSLIVLSSNPERRSSSQQDTEHLQRSQPKSSLPSSVVPCTASPPRSANWALCWCKLPFWR
jgi:hypothetical protein